MHSFYLLLLFTFFSFSLRAEILKDVVVTGNKRTDKSAILKHGQIQIGANLSEEDIIAIKENLGRINQIRIKKFEFIDGILNIDIEDKWTLFPVPMITQSGSYHNRGIVLYDDNFLGKLGTLAPGISWANSIFNYLLYFQDESLFNSTTGLKALVMKRSEFVEFKRKDILITQYESRFNSFLLTPNYLYKDQVFKAGPVIIDKKILDKLGNNILDDKSSGLFFRHHWNHYQSLEVMYQGLVTTYDLYILKSKNGQWAILNEFIANMSIPIEESFFNFGMHGFHTNINSLIFAKNIGGDEGFRGYDKTSVPLSQNLGSYIQYQQHLFKRFYFSPFYEYNNGRLTNAIQSTKSISESTIGAGIRYYFKKISIPAVMFDFGRNINDKSNHYLLNIGLSI